MAMTVQSTRQKHVIVRLVPRKSLRRRFKTGKTRRKTKKSSHLARTLITPSLLQQSTRVHNTAISLNKINTNQNKIKYNRSQIRTSDQKQITPEQNSNDNIDSINHSEQQHSTKLHDSNDVKPIVSKPAYPQSASQKSSSDHTYHLIPSISTEKKMKLFPDTTKTTLPSIVINKPLSTITRFTKKSSVFPVIQEPQQSPEKKKKKGKRIAPWMIVLCSILPCLLVTGIILAIVIPLITKQNEIIKISTNSSSTTIPACTAASHTPCSTIILQDINSGLSSTSWTYISCCYIAPTISQSTIEFIIQADSGNWLIDDVSATQGHGELISNGGFEYGITNWTFIVYPNATSTTNVDSVSNNHRTGFAYLYGSSTNAPDYVKQTFSFISGQNILIGFWESYMTSLGGGFGTIELTVTLT